MKMTPDRVAEANAMNVQVNLSDPEGPGNMTTVVEAWETVREGVWCAAPHCKASHEFTISVAIVLREGSDMPLPMIALSQGQELNGEVIGTMANCLITKDALAELITDAQAAFEALP